MSSRSTGELDYRSAHKVVGRAVRDLVETGEPPSKLTPERLARAAEAVIGTPVELDEATLRDALDPAACAAARLQTGSSSEAAMAAMLNGIDAALAERTRAGATRHGSARLPQRRRYSRAHASSPEPLLLRHCTVRIAAPPGSTRTNAGRRLAAPGAFTTGRRTVMPFSTLTRIVRWGSVSVLAVSALLIAATAGTGGSSEPLLQMPFACGQTWGAGTYSGHWPDPDSVDLVERADNNDNGSANISEGEPVVASADGTVVYVGESSGGTRRVYVDHGNGYATLYLHIEELPPLEVGDRVAQGEQIARTSNSGTNAVHLHYTQTTDLDVITTSTPPSRSSSTACRSRPTRGTRTLRRPSG